MDYEGGIHPSRTICQQNFKMLRIFMNRIWKIIMLEACMIFFSQIFQKYIQNNLFKILLLHKFSNFENFLSKKRTIPLRIFLKYLRTEWLGEHRVVGRGPKVSYLWFTYFIFTNSLFPSDFSVIEIIITSLILPCFIRSWYYMCHLFIPCSWCSQPLFAKYT